MTKVLTSFLICLIACSPALAEIFPGRTGNTDILYTQDTYVDIATKVWMIDHAQKTVDVSAFVIGNDQFGLSGIAALRRALNRGVEVRVMYESTVSRTVGKDPFLITTDLLVDPTLKKQAKILNLGIIEKSNSSMAINDYLHEKFILVDVMTDNEMIYFGGRDMFEFNRSTVDSGYFIRPLDRNYTYVGDDIRTYYNSLWTLLCTQFSIVSTSERAAESAREKLKKLVPLESSFSEDTRLALKKMIEVLSRKPKADDKLEDFQFRPKKAQVVTNDIIRKLIVARKGKKFAVRPELYKEDDILKAIVYMTNQAAKIDIVSYSSHFVIPMHQALKELINRGGQLSIFTNGYEAMASIDALGVSSVSFDYTVQMMRNLKEAATRAQNSISKISRFQVKGLDKVAALKASKGLSSYVHRKMMLFDDRYVLTGSYNFTESSSSKNDEFIVTFDDPRMNAHHRKITQIENKTVYKPIDLREEGLLDEAAKSAKRFFMGTFVKSQY